MAVNRCTCLDLSFAQLKELAARLHLDFDGLRARTRCCTMCSLCEPYVRLMLKTGQTDLPVMPPVKAEEMNPPPPGFAFAAEVRVNTRRAD